VKVTILAAAAALLLVGGCGAEPAASPHAGHAAAPGDEAAPAQVLSVEQLAASLSCDPKISLAVSDYRRATCEAQGMKFQMLDFASTKGQRDWLEGAEMYGGVFLVGDRWVLGCDHEEHLESLRKTLGGTVEDTGAHH
jgi:hypothetical protein